MESQWYYLGKIRYYSITYDVYRLFGVTLMREHYNQVDWRTGKPTKKLSFEIEEGSLLAEIIRMQLTPPADVFDLLDRIAVNRAINGGGS